MTSVLSFFSWVNLLIITWWTLWLRIKYIAFKISERDRSEKWINKIRNIGTNIKKPCKSSLNWKLRNSSIHFWFALFSDQFSHNMNRPTVVVLCILGLVSVQHNDPPLFCLARKGWLGVYILGSGKALMSFWVVLFFAKLLNTYLESIHPSIISTHLMTFVLTWFSMEMWKLVNWQWRKRWPMLKRKESEIRRESSPLGVTLLDLGTTLMNRFVASY